LDIKIQTARIIIGIEYPLVDLDISIVCRRVDFSDEAVVRCSIESGTIEAFGVPPSLIKKASS